MSKSTIAGKLILLTTPIGNKEDITLRAQKALEEGSYFAAEDSRVLQRIFQLYDLDKEGKTIFPLHEHSNPKDLNTILQVLMQGNDVYLVSDAGSPVVSDPGYPLVKLALQSGVEVDSYSGITSWVCSLELSGLPPYPCTFHGFLPKGEGKLQSLMSGIKRIGGTHIFFESPNRILKTLEVFSSCAPQAQFALIREATKVFQSVARFMGEEFDKVKESIKTKGEMTLVVYSPGKMLEEIDILEKLELGAQRILSGEGNRQKEMSKLLAMIDKRSPKEVYHLLHGKLGKKD